MDGIYVAVAAFQGIPTHKGGCLKFLNKLKKSNHALFNLLPVTYYLLLLIHLPKDQFLPDPLLSLDLLVHPARSVQYKTTSLENNTTTDFPTSVASELS